MRMGTPCASESSWIELPARWVDHGCGLFALAVARDARCSFVSVGYFAAASAMISPIARRGKSRSRAGVSRVQGLAMTCDSEQLFDQETCCCPVPTDESARMVSE